VVNGTTNLWRYGTMGNQNNNENCRVCFKLATLKVEPNRHATSPNSINWGKDTTDEHYYDYYCSEECKRIHQSENYAYWAELDENTSDSECFEAMGWDGIFRIGKCKVTGQRVRVEPLMPWNNSGQPDECTKHFKLRKKYHDLIYG